MSEKSKTIKKWATSKKHRDNYDRIFNKKDSDGFIEVPILTEEEIRKQYAPKKEAKD